MAELKSNLHKFIVETNDEAILQYIENVFIHLTTTDDDWWDGLADHDKSSVNRGIKQLHEGISRPHDEVMSKINRLITARG